ncbi:hypothetical protein B0H11DRAFT_2204324 [Mycena galericulata]|nr:hypothetical protein B0H11DRAFT_2204324 [Mycena galericulata]
MPPKAKAPTAPKSQAPKKARKSRAKAKDPPPEDAAHKDDDSSDVEITSGKKPREVVNWVQNPQWTRSIITYLTDNPPFRIKLFSDSTADAKQDGRAKLVGKDGKPQQFAILGAYVFSEDPKEQARYANNPGKYATSVETRMRRLKKEYKAWVEILGATGAGLQPAQVIPGSKIESLLGDIRSKWPWWDDLHPFWRELPNYNPVGVQSSEPGKDHAADAESLFKASGAVDASDDEDGDDGRSATSRARDEDDRGDGREEDDGGDYQSHESEPDEDDIDALTRSSTITPPPQIPPAAPVKKAASAPKSKPAAGGRDLGLAKARETSSSAGATKTGPKRPVTAIDRMNDLRETESARLTEKRQMQHTEEMARIRVKKVKYDLRLLEAQNERKRLNNHAWSSPASPRRARVKPRSPARPRMPPLSPPRFDNSHLFGSFPFGSSSVPTSGALPGVGSVTTPFSALPSAASSSALSGMHPSTPSSSALSGMHSSALSSSAAFVQDQSSRDRLDDITFDVNDVVPSWYNTGMASSVASGSGSSPEPMGSTSGSAWSGMASSVASGSGSSAEATGGTSSSAWSAFPGPSHGGE